MGEGDGRTTAIMVVPIPASNSEVGGQEEGAYGVSDVPGGGVHRYK